MPPKTTKLKALDGESIDLYSPQNTSKVSILTDSSSFKLTNNEATPVTLLSVDPAKTGVTIPIGDLKFSANTTIKGNNTSITIGSGTDVVNLNAATATYNVGTLTGSPTITGMLTLKGQGDSGSNAYGMVSDVALNIEHATAGGSSSIYFKSTQNSPSDYGYIRFKDTTGAAGTEFAQLIIGIENDGGAPDSLMLKGYTIINSDSFSTDWTRIATFQASSVEKAYIDNNGDYFKGSTKVSYEGHTHTYDNYQKWTAKAGAADTGYDVTTAGILILAASGAASIARSTNTITISATDTNDKVSIDSTSVAGYLDERLNAGTGLIKTKDTPNNYVSFAHADTSTMANTSNSGRTYIQNINVDDMGHITSVTTAAETVTDTNNYLSGVVYRKGDDTAWGSSGDDWEVVYSRTGLADIIVNATHTHNYLPLGGGSLTGALTVTGGSQSLTLKAGASVDHVYMQFYADSQAQSTRSAWIGYGAGGSSVLTINNEMANANIELTTNGTGIVRINSNTVWHAGNDGSGSGLDADKLDNKESSAYMSSTTYCEKYTVAAGGLAANTNIVIPNSRTYVTGTNRVMVFRDQFFQIPGVDWVEVDTTKIKLTYALVEGSIVTIYINNAG